MKFTSAGLMAATSVSLSMFAPKSPATAPSLSGGPVTSKSPSRTVVGGKTATTSASTAGRGTLTVTAGERRSAVSSGLTMNGLAGAHTLTFNAADVGAPDGVSANPVAMSIVTRKVPQSADQASISSATLTVAVSGFASATATVPSLSAALVSDEPAYNSNVTSTLVYQDDMNSYVSALLMGALPLGTTPRFAPISAPVTDGVAVDINSNQVIAPGRDGTGKALRLSYTGVNQFSANWATVNTPITARLGTHYFQYYARVNFPQALTGVLAVKWFEAWHETNTRVQWNLHDHLPCPISNINTYWQVLDQGETTCQGNQPVGPYFDNIMNQGWHRYTYSFRPNTSIGSRDGFARMWIDGVKVIDVSAATIGVTPAFGEKPWCLADDVDKLVANERVTYLRFGSTQTTTTTPWTLDIDDFVWWTN